MSVIIKPLVTEKMTKISEKLTTRSGFDDDSQADNNQNNNSREDLYGVKVVKVNTLIAPAKKRNRYTKSGVISGSVSSYKKAIVTLAEGNSIDFYSNI